MSDELNLIPYLDIVVNLVMFLLLATTQGSPLATLTVFAPQSTERVAPGPLPQEAEITVAIGGAGYRVTGTAAGWEAEIPRKGESLDVDALSAHLRGVFASGSYASLPPMTIAAEDDIELTAVVETIDAVRSRTDGSPLFPAVRLAKIGFPPPVQPG